MNKIYKVIFNVSKGAYVVVSEIGKSHAKASSSNTTATNLAGRKSSLSLTRVFSATLTALMLTSAFFIKHSANCTSC